MRVLLTGVTGYLGSRLAVALIEAGHVVVAIKRKKSSLHRLERIKHKIIFYDIENLDFTKLFQEQGHVDVVVHIATCYGKLGESISEILDVNLSFPLRLLELSKLFNVKTFINTDTFFNTRNVQYSYLSAYSLTKKQFAEWGRQASIDGATRFINIRLEHLYGPGDNPSKFTTWVVDQCLLSPLKIELTAGEQFRDFVYIDDVVNAYCVLISKAEKLNKGYLEIGLGSGNAISVREFVETTHYLSKSKAHLDFSALPYRDHEIMYSQANIQHLELLGWSNKTNLNDGIKAMIEYGLTSTASRE